MPDQDAHADGGGDITRFDVVLFPNWSPNPRRTIRAPKRCHRYVPGHTVHWIHAKKAAEEPGEAELGTVVAVEELIVIRVGDEIRRYFNHESERFDDAIDIHGREVEVDERWHLLRVAPGYLFNVRRVDEGEALTGEVTYCDHGPTGGFTVRLSGVD